MYLPLSQLLTAGRPPDHKIAVRAGQIIPFRRFYADVAHNAGRLKAAHCRTGAPVCIDSYWLAVGFLALCHAGASVVMPHNTQPGTLKSLSTECDLLLADPATAARGNFLLEAGQDPLSPLEPYDPSLVAVDFFTSGSTGAPKKVKRTARLLECEVEMIIPPLGAATANRLVSGTVSHQHVYGFIFRLLWPLSAGNPFSAITHDVWETALGELEPGGVLVTSPAHLSRLAGIDAIAPHRAPSLVLSAGAPLSPEAAREGAAILGVHPTEIFGSTETGACAVRNSDIPDAPWRGLPGVRLHLTPENALVIQSPAVAAETGIATGDVAEFLPGNSFRLKGRSDRIVKIEGKRVSLPEIERELEALPYVDDAAVILVMTPRDRLGAVVVASAAGRAKLSELGEFRFGRLLRQELSRTQEPAGLPRLWRFTDTLPISDMGKRRDSDLARLFLKSGTR